MQIFYQCQGRTCLSSIRAPKCGFEFDRAKRISSVTFNRFRLFDFLAAAKDGNSDSHNYVVA